MAVIEINSMPLTPEEGRQLFRQDSYYLLLPLELGPEPHSMAAHIRQVARIFLDKSHPSPSVAALDHLAKLYNRSVSAHNAIACKKGCGYCCSQPVVITAPEAFVVARALGGNVDTRRAVDDTRRLIKLLPRELRWKDWPQCPLLAEGACSIYEDRPLGCHGFVSLDFSTCRTAFVDREVPNVPMPVEHISMLQACRMVLQVAQRLIGATAHYYEMNSAVAFVLSAPDAEVRWLAGEDVLAGLEDLQAEPRGPIAAEMDAMMAFVGQTL